ncbi:STAS domain-containing protein [Massilia putida]|uniref:STAS domain-containing protein n=1 Tax=Massilia putida TaxID=1141883 RepID=UPI000951F548|nr:STAS domain-containing protein [Massilia putida]
MSIGETSQGAATCLAVEGEMTIYRAAELHPALLDAVRTHDTPALDLSAVTEFDSAGVQLLLVARREAGRLGKRLVLQGASPAVRDAFALLGLTCEGDAA